MKLKRIFCIVMTAIMLMGFAGCSKTVTTPSTSAIDSSDDQTTDNSSSVDAVPVLDPVTLHMVLLGDSPTDAAKVYDAINERLKKDINATVTVEFLSWADWSTRYPLILASGADYDLIASANWSDYFKNARSGAFWEITQDALEKYAPQTYQNTPVEVLQSALVDDKLYNLPMNYKEVTIDGYIVRGDLMEKHNIPDIKSMKDFGVYLQMIKDNYPDMIPWDTIGNGDNGYMFRSGFMIENGYRDLMNGNGAGPVVCKVENNPVAVSIYDLPGIEDYYKMMKEWNDAGYWSKSALVNTTPARDSFVNGKSAAFVDNLLQASATYTQLKASNPDWELRFYPVTDKPLIANPFINNGVAINANSENPERALMMLDLLRNDEWYNQTTTYGIEGVHWDLNDDGKLVSLPDGINFAPDSACPWGWRDSRFYLTPADGFPNYEDLMSSAQNKAIITNISSFSSDKSKGNITSQEASMQNLKTQYLDPMMLGFTSNVEEDFETLKSQYENAGLAELIDEYQLQLDAFGVTVK